MVYAAEDAEDPAAAPVYWISKWVDYTDKYGIGYQLSDNSVGVLFNDSTRLLLASNAEYKPNSITLAGSKLAPNMFGASSELAPNQLV